MKKLFYSMFAFATMLLATGCSQEEELANDSNNLVDVTFTLTSGEGTQSRAISDGKKAQQLYYGVFDQEGNVIPTLHGSTTMEDPTTGTTVNFKLVKGQTYDFVFWAQYPDNKYYNVNPQDLTEITVNYGTEANDEQRDAFFGNELDYTVEGRFTKTVVLRRPFGQLNVGTTIEDYNTAKTLLSGNAVNQSQLVVKNIPNTLNLLTSEVSGSTTDATFNLANLPTDSEAEYEILEVDVNKDEAIGEDEKYVHLSMNYLLAAETSALYEVDIKLANTVKGDINTINIPNAPIQRNYRTNILGQILTTEGDFKIYVDSVYYKDDHIYNLGEYTVASTAELKDVLNALNAVDYEGPKNVTINLANDDVEWATGNAGGGFTQMLTDETLTVTINGNNHKLTATGSGALGHKVGSMHFKDITIEDQTKYTAENGEAAWEFCYLELVGTNTFENVTFANTVMFDGNAVVKNSVFKGVSTNESNKESEYTAWVDNGSAVFENCTFEGYRGLKIHEAYGTDITAVTVLGCTFKDIDKKPGIVLGTIGVGENGQYTTNDKTYTGTPAVITIKNNTFINTQIGHHVSDNKGTDYGIDYILETDTKISDLGNQLIVEGNSVENNGTLIITSAAGLKNFAESVNSGNTYAGKTVELGADIDLGNMAWTPIGEVGYVSHGQNQFQGTFDGKNYTISNLNVTHTEAAGLFGGIAGGATIQNVKLNGVTANSNHYVGAVVGWVEEGGGKITITGCSVTNATLTSTPELVNSVYDNGDKVGGIVGFSQWGTITNNTVSNTTIKGYRDLGGIVGHINNATVTGNTVGENVTIIVDKNAKWDYKKDEYNDNTDYDANSIIGGGGTADSSNTGTATIKYIDATGLSQDAEGNYLIATAADMSTFANTVNNGNGFSGKTVKLTANIDLAGIDWIPVGQTGGYYAKTYFQGTFDGNGKIISNLTVTHWEGAETEEENKKGQYYASGLFGFIDAGACTIKNLKIDGAVVKGHHWCGVIAGFLTGEITDCEVKNAAVECSHLNDEACGDKAGVIAGYINGNEGKISKCKAIDSTVKAGRHAGQIVGYAKASLVTECTVSNVAVSAIAGCTGADVTNGPIGKTVAEQ